MLREDLIEELLVTKPRTKEDLDLTLCASSNVNTSTLLSVITDWCSKHYPSLPPPQESDFFRVSPTFRPRKASETFGINSVKYATYELYMSGMDLPSIVAFKAENGKAIQESTAVGHLFDALEAGLVVPFDRPPLSTLRADHIAAAVDKFRSMEGAATRRGAVKAALPESVSWNEVHAAHSLLRVGYFDVEEASLNGRPSGSGLEDWST